METCAVADLAESSDAFYAQVEQVRLGLSPDVPLAIQQWSGLIAVNYSAKKAGIKRMCTIEEARKLCPDIVLVHVATFANQDPEPRYWPNPHYSTHKVSLEPYRRASARIFSIFQRHASKLERAGMDECFMDVTEEVNQKLFDRYGKVIQEAIDAEDESEYAPIDIDWTELGILVEDNADGVLDGEKQWKWEDVQLAIGAELSSEIRNIIYTELGYTCSTGIAHCKALAKLCSALNKPNKQTILRTSAVPELMKKTPFQKIRNLGGKFGAEVENELNVKMASELWQYSKEELQAKFGQSAGQWLYDICRGIDYEDVTQRQKSKSMMAHKSFRPPLRNWQAAEPWFNILASEVYTRIMFEHEMNQRWPKTLTVHARIMNNYTGHSKSCPMPSKVELKSPDVLAAKAGQLFKSFGQPFPAINFSIVATGLQKDDASNMQDIKTLFGNISQKPKDLVDSEDDSIPLTSQLPIDLVSKSDAPVRTPFPVSTHKTLQTSRQGLRRFFMQQSTMPSPKSDDNLTPSVIAATGTSGAVCLRCGKSIPHHELAEHEDWHFAVSLYESERVSPSTQPAPIPSKRPSPTQKATTAKKPKRELFFKPRAI